VRPARSPLLSLIRATGCVAALSLGLTATPLWAAPADDLKALMDDYYQWSLEQDPILASSVGVETWDDQLPDYSLAAADRAEGARRGFLARLDAIPAQGLPDSAQADHAILHRMLSEAIAANGFGQRVMLFTTYYSPWQGWASIPDAMAFRKQQDYSDYLARLEKIPTANDTVIGITRKAIKGTYTLPCSVLGGLEGSISGVVVATDVTQSRLYGPFSGARPGSISEADWAALQARAQKLLAGPVSAAYTKAAKFVHDDYLPACRQEVGISAQPGGAAYYAAQIASYTTTALDAEQIHALGLSEVERIRSEMDAVAKAAGYAQRADFVKELRGNPKYYAKTPAELMAAAALQAKTIDGHMPELFGKLPRLSYGLRAVPAEIAEGTTTAYYQPGSPANGVAGFYFVNTSKLDQRPLYELPALTAHEAVPGHHNQIALQQELDIHPLRRNLASFTAFVEGWALYSERLGIEIGLYDTPEKQYGRLSYEMWRACRLVVDTGIHAKGWSKQQAVDFMTENTALSAANIDAEVNRYISWPGQALGYKIGELRIRALREKAEQALGAEFRLPAFHDVVLGEGPVPLDLLEARVNTWIAARQH